MDADKTRTGAVSHIHKSEARLGATASVLVEVSTERARQDAKWGLQRHGPQKWISILGEEFGEVCAAHLAQKESDPKDYRDELVQVAAVAVAAIEAFDENRRCECNRFQTKGSCWHVSGGMSSAIR